jgi:hypothetical protein
MQTVWSFLWGTIPWWIWTALGVGAAVAARVFVRGRLGQALAVAVLCLTVLTAAYSRGLAWEKARWVAEVARLQAQVDAAQTRELLVAQQAQADMQALQKELDDAKAAMALSPDRDRIVIPEPWADRLRNLGR